VRAPQWQIPIEAIRASADFQGTGVLARLAAQRAVFMSDASVELTERGFIGAIRYTLPGAPDRIHGVTVGLVWHPSESVRAAA
jgi:hypothetical protein